MKHGFYYYGARYYNPRESLWLSTDPLFEMFPGRSTYEYTFSNPVNLTDPTGMAPDWHEDGKGNLVADKGDNAGSLARYLNKNYKNAKVSQSAANTLYSSLEGGKVNIDQLNPETLNKNIFGYNYPGSKNPRKYNGKSDYSTPPQYIEIPAYLHDQDYDKTSASGASGLILDSKTIVADQNFMKRMDRVIEHYKKEGRQIMVTEAAIIKVGVGIASYPKRALNSNKGCNCTKEEFKRKVLIYRGQHNFINLRW